MKRDGSTKMAELRQRRDAPLATPTDLTRSATKDITGAMNAILADVFALYLKTKNFHWHISGPHFRDYHLLLDEQAEQLFAMTDPIAERVRKLGGLTIKSISHISGSSVCWTRCRLCRSTGHDRRTGRRQQNPGRTSARGPQCDRRHRDVATTSLIEVWIDETERRTWFLTEVTRRAN